MNARSASATNFVDSSNNPSWAGLARRRLDRLGHCTWWGAGLPLAEADFEEVSSPATCAGVVEGLALCLAVFMGCFATVGAQSCFWQARACLRLGRTRGSLLALICGLDPA